jgi:hypothetical protein
MTNKLLVALFIALCFTLGANAQSSLSSAPNQSSMALGPARFELEMKPGTETTVVVNLDYRNGGNSIQPARIVASLSDWRMTRDGQIEYYRPGTRPDSASSWVIYSPGEAAVQPGTVHSIRVTISVPSDATPGDHLTALIVEQRPDTIKYEKTSRQMIVRYRMASVFYIKVGTITRRGNFNYLYAESTPNGIVVTPTLKNEGNTMIRPLESITIVDADGRIVADFPIIDPLPILAASETAQAVQIERVLPAGKYTVKCRVDFQDGSKVIEGITDLVVKSQVASVGMISHKP